MARATGLKFRPITSDFEEMTNIIAGMPSYFWLTSSRLKEPIQDDVPYTAQALGQDLLRVRNAWDECQAHRERDAIYPYLTAVFELVAWWAVESRAISRARWAIAVVPLGFADYRRTVCRCHSLHLRSRQGGQANAIKMVARAAVRSGIQVQF